MPLVKRHIKPHHVCHVVVPESVSTELECVTNNTLSSIIHQLSSLSKQAEGVFGELFNEANTFYVRANSLQDRVEGLAGKVTRLDFGLAEASLLDVSMWKAFKSSSVEDQQVVSRCSVPNPVAEMYISCEKPAALSLLSTSRDDHMDGMKFYSDPSYFFDLWKEKMLHDTEDKKKARKRQREQRCGGDGILLQEVCKVCKAQNGGQVWDMTSLNEQLHPGNPHSVQQGAKSDSNPDASKANIPDHAHFTTNHTQFMSNHVLSTSSKEAENEYQSISGPVSMADRVSTGYSSEPLPPQFAPINPSTQGSIATPITPPAPPSYCGIPPAPLPGPPLVPPPLPLHPVPLHLMETGQGRSQASHPITDGRSDLLSAIRMGIQLQRVQEQQVMRECSENDVASILSRRIAVEYSDSEGESELDGNEWSD